MDYEDFNSITQKLTVIKYLIMFTNFLLGVIIGLILGKK
jgi:hypothetical protein